MDKLQSAQLVGSGAAVLADILNYLWEDKRQTRKDILLYNEENICDYDRFGPVWMETEITVTDKGKEEVIELPQGMITEVDSLLHLYNTKTYMKPATDCNVPNVNPIYTKEEYMERLKRIPSVIEMPYNDIVQKFIDRYSSRLRRSVSYMLGAQNFYMPIFEQALETYGLPSSSNICP